jgi:hypothetical protein
MIIVDEGRLGVLMVPEHELRVALSHYEVFVVDRDMFDDA